MARAAERNAGADDGRAVRPPLEAFWTGRERSVMRVWQRSPALAWSLAVPVPAAARSLDAIAARPSSTGDMS
jgi:hypothetical protein